MSKSKSRDQIISLVNERLDFVQIITNLNPQFFNDKSGKPIMREMGEGWTNQWEYFDSLRIYLLLTCFDLLGQSDDWKDFDSWLNAKSKTEEVTEIIKKVKDLNDLEKIKSVHKFYKDAYGTKNSFYRFINEVLSQESKKALLYSIDITRCCPYVTYNDDGTERGRGSSEIEKITDDESKIKFLYWMRNAYTHEAMSIGSPVDGIWENARSSIVNGVELHGWLVTMARPVGELDHFYQYGFRKWPEVLIETVKAGLKNLKVFNNNNNNIAPTS